MEDAIQQLIDLGVTRGQARKALARYNNDVARAADYIFSGADLSDDDTDETNLETDEQLALRLSIEEEKNQALFDDNNKETAYLSPISTPQEEKPPAVVPQQHYDLSKWSVVPFQQENMNTTTTTSATTTTTTKNNEFSLTWWKDPEDPNERKALDDLPIGLRPPYNFAYSPIVIQALFHITAFREIVFVFRPIPYEWGGPSNYWKGFGDSVSAYIMKEVITKRQITPSPDLITFDEQELSQLSLNNDVSSNSSSINEAMVESDLPPLIVESTTPIQEIEEEGQIESEPRLMPKCIKSLAELQKCFAFLNLSTRQYGNISHYVRALNTKLTANGWESSDKTYEAFLDMMIHDLIEADEHSDNLIDYIPIFKR
ncbi:uncharacterized protein BX663DRAFT_258807 [Cokeromyces recurvatus]|uniref:uncharacterized protein n=1 Tax=Cokeromyces recurvatus TaxID=90255 RepID=UPI002220DCE2|nr:uncharacterized protein BX663DRAFT_258807 [Cokeromyces recurvatus]KAI7898468.1 hypothetical protein BX663DRAFT_258807 [Cokeromyces recurvatus]